jgi:hypothetical protein
MSAVFKFAKAFDFVESAISLIKEKQIFFSLSKITINRFNKENHSESQNGFL